MGTVDRVFGPFPSSLTPILRWKYEEEHHGDARWRLDVPYRVSGRMGRQDSGLASTANP